MEGDWFPVLDTRETYVHFNYVFGVLMDRTFLSGLWEERPMVRRFSKMQYQETHYSRVAPQSSTMSQRCARPD